MRHVTIIKRTTDRRITGAVGSRTQLCGADPTSEDVTVLDAARIIRGYALDDFPICPHCIQASTALTTLTHACAWRSRF